MKTFALAAVLWLGAAQTVSFSNCCRGSFCDQKENCPPCGSTSDAGRSCCDGEQDPASPDRVSSCVHLEPASEIQAEGAVALPEAPEPLTGPLLDILETPSSVVAVRRRIPGPDPPTRPHRDLPLFLQDSALLI